ncbi:MAG: CHASE2 domain-containing protein [Deltaproteobacteria bacterium]|nr:CHASE2 domain-containing protein [Deltaproteobacteria bacterium]
MMDVEDGVKSKPVQRKLAAILSADVKGYSRLMGQDEAATVKSIRACRTIMASAIASAHGRIVDSPGDNVLAEFGSAVDALECAVVIQESLKAENAQFPADRRMVFRIGINIGDVIVEGDEIYGDGVNIAARLEGLADPGGICISGTLYDQVKRKVHYRYDFMGRQEVKNISEAVRAYRVIWNDADVSKAPEKRKKFGRLIPFNEKGLGFVSKIILTSLLMLLIMPFVNHFKINLLTKMWQCRLTLLPNTQQVTVVTIDKDEYRKMNVKDKEAPPPFDARPRLWRQYYPKVIHDLFQMGVGAVGFDFWYSPAIDSAEKKATEMFVASLKWAGQKGFPVILGQYQNTQDKAVYAAADWGFISVYRDLTWINEVMYLKTWDKMAVSGELMERPGFFLQVLAEKLRLKPVLGVDGVRLMGPPIPRRLWLAFAETPFTRVPFHEIYNGWADKKLFAGRIVLIGMGGSETDYFHVPYSPTDFTPHDKKDGYGMPGVFLFAHAINQVIQGYYHKEVNDEWALNISSEGMSLFHLESIFYLLIETIGTCLLLFGVFAFAGRKGGTLGTFLFMGVVTAALMAALAFVPVLFGLANFFFAGLVFSLLSVWRMNKPNKLI